MLPLITASQDAPDHTQPGATQFDADFDASLGVPHKPAPAASPRAAPAASGPGAAAPKPVGKVELDLDGAPFLEPDEPPPPPKKQEPAAPAKTAAAKPATKKNKKKLLIIAGGALLLVSAAAYFFLFRGDSEPKEATPEKPAQKVVVVPSTPKIDAAPTDQFMIDFPQFWVELKDNEGEIRFLNCKIMIPSNSEFNVKEINAKMTVIRDAVYYYLKNKPYAFLSDNKNMNTLTQDMAAIISENLMTEKVNEVLLENYIIK
ncbi:MAG: flagellar basal body-associated FliL family protein [Deltaproteobacteria bacterium]|jgi:flagellar FliL protein|nr:flagellar basal body-associated FliL family protein [Deltaproteobacteria bacterium]